MINQIAIGDATDSGGWLVLSGQSVAPPFKRADYEPVFSPDETVAESLLLSLEGSPVELAGALAALDAIAQRLSLYQETGFPARPSLRFQPAAADPFFYAPLLSLDVQVNPNAPRTRLSGSLLVTLRFTRENHYDSDPIELPLSGQFGEDVLGGADLINHTDYHTGHGNSILVKPEDIESDLPAPLRLEITNTMATGTTHDVFTGIYHHPTYDEDDLFFYYAGDFNGGSLFSNAAAINAHYLQVGWSGVDWNSLGYWALLNDAVKNLAGQSFRPVLHFFTDHGYADLLLKMKLQTGDNILWESDAVYADPNFGYVLFPPVQIPPNRLLNETYPHQVALQIYGQRETTGDHTVEFDCLTLMPLSPGANFIAFYDLFQNATLIDDNHLNAQITRYTEVGSEIVSHLRQGAELLLWPGRYNRLLLLQADADDQLDPARTTRVRLYYRKRKRVL